VGGGGGRSDAAACCHHVSTRTASATCFCGLQLFTHREDVDALNNSELRALPGDTVTFAAQNSGPSPAALDSGCPVSSR